MSFNLDGEDSIWVHAVSVGEVLAARPVIAELRKRYPSLRLFLSTTTLHGPAAGAAERRRRGRHLLSARSTGPSPSGARCALVKPRLFVMVETEIWPNLLRECRAARREDGGGQRPHLAAIVSALPPDSVRSRACWPTSIASACRAKRRRGVSSPSAPTRRGSSITGSLKFDALQTAPVPGRGPRARAALLPRVRRTGRCSWRAARCGRRRAGDPRLQPAARHAAAARARCWCIAARHPERFAEVERLCRQEGLATVRRTELPIDAEPRADAVILDTIGELAQLYQIATAVFVGGSLVPAGGHNILEPAAHGKADRVRPAHGELQGDRRRRSSPTMRPCRCRASASWRRRC